MAVPMLRSWLSRRCIGSRRFHTSCKLNEFILPQLDDERTSLISHENYDTAYLLNPSNHSEIIKNIKLRRCNQQLVESLDACVGDSTKINEIIKKNLSLIPSKLHEKWTKLDPDKVDITEPLVPVEVHATPKVFDFTPQTAEKCLKRLKLCWLSSDRKLATIAGPRSYVLIGDLVRLENALLDWTMTQLMEIFNFTPVVVPNLIYDDIVAGCGFNPYGERSQVYTVDGNDRGDWLTGSTNKRTNAICLSGTSEIPLVSIHLGKCFEVESGERGEDLPKRYCATSRCYRAEVSELSREGGLYRVHYFNKVEMVSLTRQEDAEKTLKEFVDIQKYLFSQLDLHFRVVDMPPFELGLPARQKYDIEAWFHGRKMWGEISSASDCGDFQSRRMNTRYRVMEPDYNANTPFKEKFVNIVNGTACASPRILIPLVEQNQDSKNRIRIPRVLRDLMGQEYLNHM